MTTARAKLHAELVEILGAKDREDAERRLQTLVSRYRVQFKKPPSDKAQTAREALLDGLIGLQKRPPKDLLGQVAAILDEYRMQQKAAAKPKAAGRSGRDEGRRRKKGERRSGAAGAADSGASATGKAASPGAGAEPASSSVGTRVPVAGGPPKSRRSTRAECPKCHSMGVVLARSYAADEYYSCIYCGWQGFRSPEALEAQDSLAARLLGLYNSPGPDEGDG